MSRRSVVRAAGALVLLCLSPGLAAQPANDNFASAEPITTIPFSDTENAQHQATSEAADPFVLCRAGAPAAPPQIRGGNTIWYRFQPAVSGYYNLSTTTSVGGDTMIAVYRGDTLATLQMVAGGCADDDLSSTLSLVAGLRLQAGVTYHIEVARFTASTTTTTTTFTVTNAPRYNVSKTTDTADGTCDADCSLREAITAANAAPGAVILDAGTYLLSRTGAEDANASGDLDVRGSMGLYGRGGTLNGPDATVVTQTVAGERVFHMPATARVNVHFHDLQVGGGTATGDGGGLLSAGTQLGNLALERVAFGENTATGVGGGLRVNHAAQFYDSTFAYNAAGDAGGGAALMQARHFEIQRSSFFGNQANGTAATAGGGGVLSSGTVRASNTSFFLNSAAVSGGGLLVTTSAGSLGLFGATVGANSADSDGNGTGTGAGVQIDGTIATGHVIEHSLLANNVKAPQGAAMLSDCARAAAASAIASRYTLVRQPEASCTFSGPGDVVGVDPQFPPSFAQVENGTYAIVLPASSPAIDAGDPSGGCEDEQDRPLVTDQRTRPRPSGPRCDLGAVELTVLADGLFANSFE